MKNVLKIVFFAIFSLFFYFVLSTNFKENTLVYYNSTEQNAPENLKSIDSTDLYFSTRNTNTVAVAKNNVNFSYKNFSNTLFATHLKTIEGIIQIVYTHYTLHSKNTLFRWKQTQILFPFHYHW